MSDVEESVASGAGDGAGSGGGASRRPSRSRKTVAHFNPVATMPEPEQWEVPTGSGVLLSEQPYVDEMVRHMRLCGATRCVACLM